MDDPGPLSTRPSSALISVLLPRKLSRDVTGPRVSSFVKNGPQTEVERPTGARPMEGWSEQVTSGPESRWG